MWRILTCLALMLPAAADSAAADVVVVPVFDNESLYWDKEQPDPTAQGEVGYVWRFVSQYVEVAVDLPPVPDSVTDMQSITAVIEVTPQYSAIDGRRRPNDPWTRMGMLSVLVPDGAGGMVEREIVRFVTPYGGAAVFEQDVTALAPLLHGRQTLRAFISTYSEEPGWTISVSLRYSDENLGARRPRYVRHVFSSPHITSINRQLKATLTIPKGMDMPRLRILTTGHATDGTAENEFISCPHVLRIDGQIVAKWRPWSEKGATLRDMNPTAGRWTIDGREVRSSDLDRTGWHPGLVVQPTMIPLPELTPGRHHIELTVLGIRPKQPPDPEDGKEHHGYWVISAFVVADEQRPESISGGNEP